MKTKILIVLSVVATGIAYWLVRPTLISQKPQGHVTVSNLTLSLLTCIIGSGVLGAWLFRKRLGRVPSKLLRTILTSVVVVCFGLLFLFVLSALGLQTRF